MKKEMGKFLLIITLAIFLSSGIFAAAPWCSVVQRSACPTSSGSHILMGISGLPDGHGEFPDQGNYPYVVCCNFGTGNTNCSKTNAPIISLYASTNSHAEVPGETTYSNNICYEDLVCKNFASNCGTGTAANYPIGVVSLISTTNSHICDINNSNCPVKICCNSPLYGNCFIKSANWSETKAVNGEQIKMEITGSSECYGLGVTIKVLGGPSPVKTQPLNVSFNSFNSSTAMATGIWVAQHQSGLLGIGDATYYFNVSLSRNPLISLSTANSPQLDVASQGTFCDSVTTCSDYTTQTDCESDSTMCNVANDSSIPGISCNASNICSCIWNSQDNTCGFGWTPISNSCGNPTTGCNYGCTLCYNSTSTSNYCGMGSCPIGGGSDYSSLTYNNKNGSCDFGIDGCLSQDCQAGDQGTCADSLYCELGLCSSVEAPSSSTLNLGSCKITQTVTKDCTVAPVGFKTIVWNGTWIGGNSSGAAYEQCITGGETTVACPAQVQLPFFNYTDMIITLIVIALIYVTLISRKKLKGKKRRK